MKTELTAILILLSSLTFAQTFSGPESVEFDYANNRWLIANTSSHQVLARNSAGVLTVFVSGLIDGPYGIEIAGDTLFCCSGSRIKGYLLSNGAQVFNLNLNATFLNGITHDNNGNLIATDFSAKKIYKVNIANQTFAVIANNLPQSPNGIIFDTANNRCIFVNWGGSAPIKAIDLASNTITTLTATTLTNCDGIAADNFGNYYVSNWSNPGTVKKFNSTFSGAPVTVVTGLSSPADIFYNTLSDTLGIPNSGNNTVTFVGFSTASISELNSENDILVQPNPSNSGIFISIHYVNPKPITLKVLALDGRLIKEVGDLKSIATLNSNYYLNTSDLKSGIYFLIFSTNYKTILKKIIVY